MSLRALLIALLLLASSTDALADKTRAAEHFALAQSAEKRSDWRAAIREYERAYAEEPHGSVHFNIAVNYERLAEHRRATEHFLRYLDESRDAADRDEVLERVRGLRERPSRLEVASTPTGATVLVDGTPRGVTPLSIEIRGGGHEIQLTHENRRSPIRKIVAEYGAPLALDFDINAKPGRLEVHANVAAAEVRIDGVKVGTTPFSESVQSGDRQILISKNGYQSVQRAVRVPSGGSEQVRATLKPLAGTEAEAKPEPDPSLGKASFFFGLGYGLNALETTQRFAFEVGFRSASGIFDLAGISAYNGVIARAFGVQARVFFGRGQWRPYLRSAMLFGSDSGDTLIAGEAGGGLLIAAMPKRANPAKRRRTNMYLDYFVDIGAQTVVVGGEAPTMGTEPARRSFEIPITGGAILRY